MKMSEFVNNVLDKNMLMSNIHLVEKTGGKSGHFLYTPEAQNV